MKIEKCPFCGGKARWMYLKPIGRVMCKKCGASSAALSDNYEEADCQQEAIAAWNRRSDAAPVVRGEWIENPTKDSVLCSYCYADWNLFDNDTYRFCYCPNCGAKMEDKPCE
jgi:hypothetical protein